MMQKKGSSSGCRAQSWDSIGMGAEESKKTPPEGCNLAFLAYVPRRIRNSSISTYLKLPHTLAPSHPRHLFACPNSKITSHLSRTGMGSQTYSSADRLRHSGTDQSDMYLLVGGANQSEFWCDKHIMRKIQCECLQGTTSSFVCFVHSEPAQALGV